MSGTGRISRDVGSPSRVHRNPYHAEAHMERMTGIDPMFVYSDTPETPMEIAYACVFDPTTADGGYTFERVADHLEERIPSLPPFRRRLMPVPLGLDHPRWVDDPDFDLANHLHPHRPAGSRRRDRVLRTGRGGDGSAAHARAATVGDARHRGVGRRQGRADRQGAPLRRRRRGRRPDAGPAVGLDAGGPRRHRAMPALAPGTACPRRRS